VVDFNHHLSHAATAFYLSPYDRALVVILDEDGDGTSGLIAVGEGTKIRPVRRIPFPSSLGWVYTQVTELLGFAPHKDEHKTQWLSLEGEPEFKQVFLDMMRRPGSPLPRLNLGYFNRGLTGRVALSDKFYRAVGLSGRDGAVTDEQRRRIAASLQQACTEIVVDLVKHFSKSYGLSNVCLGGGLFLNPLLVASVEKENGPNQVFVPPAPGNAGCAIGAASLLWYQQPNSARKPAAAGVYWGPAFSRSEIKDTLDNSKSRYSLQITEDRKIEQAVQLLQAGKIIGWYQGATEFGPRALGNRSVLASPWAPYVKENLNDFIKHREWFRPFALAITEEECERWFEASHSCRYMNSLATVRPGHALPEGFLLPDHRVRLHVVSRQANPSFWRLLKRFGETAPAPILVNTSFNLFGEPLVVRPRDAMRSYFCSGIDALIIDNFVLSKAAATHYVVATRAS
ncbi:MAG TPA: carbamoyltransferase C-terminal domain-containing protein, partial [Terriglobales bacterium]|nr:carbamoyltransferase C-terminal domain-containing protein [Terriglobales bacterium]